MIRAATGGALLWATAGATPAHAARPDTDGEPWSFAVDDEVVYLDSEGGRVRVHYAAAGPSVTDLTDDDANGRPDLPEAMADVAEDVLDQLDALGFRPPVSEAELGIDDLGGSGAIDLYMVDFGGTGDGRFAVDACAGGVCAGHLLTDNDFAESYYDDAQEAARVLTSHELFHAVQAAYAAELPVWLSEGTATWAEHLHDPETDDYLGFCGAYLMEPTRALDQPPAGTVTAWSYGTALFFGFLQERHGADIGPDLLEALESVPAEEATLAIQSVLEDRGDSWADAWPTFAAWNLATGRYAGRAPSYPYAQFIRNPPFEVETDGGVLQDDNRFYPLATTYFRYVHGGGPLALAFADDPTGLHLGLHPMVDGQDNGRVLPAVVEQTPTEAGVLDLGSFDAGGYVLVGSYPAVAPESIKVAFCLGPPDALADCVPPADAGDGDSGAADGGADSGLGSSSGDGCGCAGTQGTGGVGALLALAGLLFSRRRPEPG